MERIEDFLGCRCHAHARFAGDVTRGRPHTFSWATDQYPKETPVVPVHEALDLNINIEKEEISGVAVIEFKVTAKEAEAFDIDAVDLRIHDVQLKFRGGWQPISFRVDGEHLSVQLGQKLKRDEKAELKIVYSCIKPRAGLYFIKPDRKYPQRPVQVWSQGQDDDARYWFPCFDQPGIKCTFELKAEVPAGFVATSNGALLSESQSGKNRVFHWKSQARMPSYLVTLTVGKFGEIKEDWRGKPVTYLFEKGREDEAKISFGKTPQMIDLFSKTLGIDYPYEKYTQIAVAEFVFGGMENTSATTQTDATLHPMEIDEDFSSDDLVSHELAHQWFGDLVTCRTWSHGWLNEGWATFMETVFKEHDLGTDETDYYRYEELQIYLAEDRSFRRPIVTNYYSDPAEVWDRHTYQKAGLVLNMLKGEIGAEDFWAGTKLYLESHRGGNVETVDFQRALEKASGRKLQRFFDQWIYKAGYPNFKMTFEWDEKEKLAKIVVTQAQTVDDQTPLFNITSKVEFFFSDKSSFAVEVVIEKGEHTFVAHLKEKPVYCRFDKGNHILKTLEWKMPQDMLIAQLNQDNDVVGRIWAMKALAKEATHEGVQALADLLKKDPFWGIRAEAALALGEAKTAAALSTLLSALKEERKSKARARICVALGKFRDETAAEALIHTLEGDKSILVRGAAAAALGKTKHPAAFENLKKAIKTKTWNDYVSSQGYVGLKNLRDDRALPLFLEGGLYGSAKFARITAVAALGEYGLDKLEVREFLEECLEDPFHRVRFSAAAALAQRKDPAAVEPLEESAHRVVDGHLKAAAFRAARAIRDSLQRPAEIPQIQETLDKIKEDYRKLRDRLDQLEKPEKAPPSLSH